MFLFACQTKAGDFRGLLANPYATCSTGAILSRLIQAGYEEEARVERCFRFVAALDSISWIGLSKEDEQIE